MLVTAVKTYRVRYYEQPSLEEVIVDCLPIVGEKTIVAITSKVVSICEGSFVYKECFTKDEAVRLCSDMYLPSIPLSGNATKRSHTLTVTGGILMPGAGIDKSKDLYILWPSDPQYTANRIRSFLVNHYGVQNVGVIITDSTTRPLRRGVTGIVLAHSGFNALSGRARYKRDVAGGLAAAAVLAMGENGERTPLAIITDVPFVEFTQNDPSDEELANIKTDLDNDLFNPLLNSVEWVTGGANSSHNSSK